MMSLREAALSVDGRTSGGDPAFTGVSTDTRTLRAGDLFVALRGERFDGHGFLGQAKAAGAVAAMVDRDYGGEFPMPVVVVDDTKRALGALARGWRGRFAPALIAVAGSNGKTTVKEMLASILRANAGDGAVLATAGNLNNDIGLPLTLLRLDERHRWCAIELGMNHKGEIAYLAAIAQPTVALVNNAQREHLEFMNSVDEVAAENASVYGALPPHGVAVVNADDPHAGFFRRAAGARRVVDFGIEAKAAVSGGYSLKALQSELTVRTPAGEARATLAIPGLHNVRNALAAAACAHAAGIGLKSIGDGLSGFRPYTGRLQVKKAASGATVIDDSYNANPDSVRAAIDVLAACPAPTVLVLGDMGEVGTQGAEFHREIGAYARSLNVSSLFALGDSTKFSVEAFGAAGYHAKSIEDLLRVVRESAKPKTTLLVKGSRFMRMERIVTALTGANTGNASASARSEGRH
jgi:UDP-N-acetylmuramoyl-tripeptide--D-alanyl-D-alanine ligase